MIEILTILTKTSNVLNIGNLEVSPMFSMKHVSTTVWKTPGPGSRYRSYIPYPTYLFTSSLYPFYPFSLSLLFISSFYRLGPLYFTSALSWLMCINSFWGITRGGLEIAKPFLVTKLIRFFMGSEVRYLCILQCCTHVSPCLVLV